MTRLGGVLVVSTLALGGLLLVGCGDDDDGHGNRATATATASATPTATPTPMTGPIVTFFGIIRADDTLIDPSGTTADGVPIFSRTAGSGFRLVIEGKPGPDGAAIGQSSYAQGDPEPTSFPDLQVEVSRPMGNGSAAVCDDARDNTGGVPATDPPNFEPTQANLNAVNDLSCRFKDGQGNPRGLLSQDACVKHLPTEEYGFVNPETTLEFCGFVTGPLAFPVGDTTITARLRDVNGIVGKAAQIVIHVGS